MTMSELLSAPHVLLPLVLTGAALLLLILAVWLSWPWLAAHVGEAGMRRQLRAFEREGALILHDIILPTQDGKTVYINHLMITRAGIIIVNTISHLGRIYGSRRDATWVSESLQGGMTRFPNPARYTAMAIKAVRRALGSNIHISDAIVCTAARPGSDMPANVLQVKQLADYIRQGEQTLSDKKMHWAKSTLAGIAIKDRACYRMYEDIFVHKHGANSYLRAAKTAMAASVVLIVAAIVIVGLHLASRR